MFLVTNDNVMGNNIRFLRQQNNIGLDEFAKRLGISASDLEAIETGENRQIEDWVLNQIFEIFSTDVQTLVEKNLQKIL
jgi:transcriptional regulator with XRE-family HTH domain